MKNQPAKVRSLVRNHAIDWIIAALAATAVALFVLALARAAGAESAPLRKETPGAHWYGDRDHRGPGPYGDRRHDGFGDRDRRGHGYPIDRALAVDVRRKIQSQLSQSEFAMDRALDALARTVARDVEYAEHELDEMLSRYHRIGDERELVRAANRLHGKLAALNKRVERLERAARGTGVVAGR